jgi:hypothetical protein
MATKAVKMSDLSKHLGQFGTASLATQKKAVGRAIVTAIPKLVAASPVDTGLYAQSWDFTLDDQKAIIGNFAPHAAVIEFGARPFTPPLGPLLAWAKRVLKDSSQPPGYSPEVQRLARGTQMKIAALGMKPKHILENAIPGIIEDIKRELAGS